MQKNPKGNLGWGGLWWERPCEEVWGFQLRLRRESQAMCSVAPG